VAKRSTNWNGIKGLNLPERVNAPRSVSNFSAAEGGRSEALFSLSSLLDYSAIVVVLFPSSTRNVFDSHQGAHDTPTPRGVQGLIPEKPSGAINEESPDEPGFPIKNLL